MTFAGQLDTRIRTGEDYATLTLAQIFALEPARRPKGSSTAFIPSSYVEHDGREHARQREHGQFVALCGDVDSGDHDLAKIRGQIEQLAQGAAWLVYSSAHSRPGDRRWRIIIPLSQAASFTDWHDAQIAFFTAMEAAGVKMDHAMARAAQPVYLPNVPAEHAKSGTPLRSDEGEPLYYERAVSSIDAPGLDLGCGEIADAILALRRQRAADDRERERLRQEAAKRRHHRAQGHGASIIEDFNVENGVATMLEICGYQQSPTNSEEWRSPHQTSETFATRIFDDKWVSLSASDAAAGVGERCASGCFGDAYDLFVHYKHNGDHKTAFRSLHEERRDANPNVVWVTFDSEPPEIEGDPGWQEMPEHLSASASFSINHSVRPARQGYGTSRGGTKPGAPASPSNGAPFDCRPVDLWARYEAPALPLGLIPEIIEQFAVAHSETMGCDPAGLAMSALAVCAAAIPDQIRVQVKRHDPTWHESSRLWVALIGPPSTKKSPIMNAALRPLNKIDAELFREYLVRMSEYEALDAKEKKGAEKPPQRRLRISDATIEAAQEVLKDSPGGVLSQQDELSGWFGAMDKYAAGKGAMADRGFWLQAFNGGSYALNRIARGAALIPNLSISVLGGIQPDPLRRIVAESVDDGLIQRLLPVQLRPAAIGRDEPQDDSVRRYDDLVRALWLLRPPYQPDGEWTLRFSEDAHAVRTRLEQKHLEMVGAELISPKLGAHFGKYDGIFARLCVLWHCAENANCSSLPQIISGDVAGRVEAFLDQFVAPSAIAFYTGVLGLSDDHDTLVELASYILTNELETVQHRDCQRASRSLRSLTIDQTRRLFEKLDSFGWLEPTEPAPKSNSPRWRVNPAAHTLFLERGKIETARREKARDTIELLLSKEG